MALSVHRRRIAPVLYCPFCQALRHWDQGDPPSQPPQQSQPVDDNRPLHPLDGQIREKFVGLRRLHLTCRSVSRLCDPSALNLSEI
ncbi:hypothetical protein KXV74_006177, partial [Aspergillus fumigatus]